MSVKWCIFLVRSLKIKLVMNFGSLYRAYKKAKRGKSFKEKTLHFSFNLEKELFHLEKQLNTKTYSLSPYKEFIVRGQKERTIKALSFRDGVVQHLICSVVEPYFEKRFIDNTFACRKNKGTKAAVEVLSKDVYNNFQEEGYALKCDIKKFFHSVDHTTLKKMLQIRITDKNILHLLSLVFHSSHSQFGKGKGIPIGNLTSQLFANIYLHFLDLFIKQELQIKYYYRYMDDFLILSKNKEELHIIKEKIKEFLQTLHLDLHPKKQQIFPISTGIDFVGYRIFRDYIRLRSSNIARQRVRLRYLRKCLKQKSISLQMYDEFVAIQYVSWNGYRKDTKSHRITQKLFPEFLKAYVK